MGFDLDRFTTPARKGPACTVGATLARLDTGQADYLRAVLSHPDVVYTLVETHSEETFGVKLPAQAVSRHVRGKCSCER